MVSKRPNTKSRNIIKEATNGLSLAASNIYSEVLGLNWTSLMGSDRGKYIKFLLKNDINWINHGGILGMLEQYAMVVKLADYLKEKHNLNSKVGQWSRGPSEGAMNIDIVADVQKQDIVLDSQFEAVRGIAGVSPKLSRGTNFIMCVTAKELKKMTILKLNKAACYRMEKKSIILIDESKVDFYELEEAHSCRVNLIRYKVTRNDLSETVKALADRLKAVTGDL